MSHMFLLFLAFTAASAEKIYEWKLPTTKFGTVTTQMTTLDKSLADDPAAYIKCFKELYKRDPEAEETKYNKEAYGRKKRDLSKSMYPYSTEIPFLISANYSLCVQRRLALAIRKFEERTCVSFVPFEGIGKHRDAVLMIHNIQNDNSQSCIANFGQYGVMDSTLDGQELPFTGSASIKNGCERSFEHEIMHVLGFIHVQDSPYREGPQEFWNAMGYPKASRTVAKTRQMAPWERNSATSYINTGVGHYLTDWDVYKINQIYNCKNTAYGRKPIDMNNKPKPVVNNFDIPKNQRNY